METEDIYEEVYEEIPVDIAMGRYGPMIMKCDIDDDGEDDLDDIVWTDQIGVYFEDGKVYMSSASGLIFKDHGWPEYEQAVEPYAQIIVGTDSLITVGDFCIVPDDGIKD